MRSLVLVQSLKYEIKEKVHAQFKLPFYALFDFPHGVRQLNVQGLLNLEQQESFSIGSVEREIGFNMFHLAENLMTMDFFNLYAYINSQNVTANFEIQN